MDKITYKSIRGERDFLCRYFVKESGMNIDCNTFSNLLGMWLMAMGMHSQQGKEMILNFLDKKFE